MTAYRPHQSSDFAIVLVPITAALFGLALGPVGLGAVILAWAIARYVGSMHACILLAIFGAALSAASIPNGRLQIGAEAAFGPLLGPLIDRDPVATFHAWLRLALDQRVSVCAFPLGLGIGGTVRLFREDRGNSGLGRLGRKKLARDVGLKSATTRASKRASSEGDLTLLGVDWSSGVPVYISDAELNNHVLLLGTTGRGKTFSAFNLVESHIDRGLPVLFLDGKGDVAVGRQIKAYAKAAGRKAYLFHAQGGGDSCAYNPFVSTDFSALADMVVTLHDWTQPYYRLLAIGYMQTVFKVALAIGQPLDLLSVEKLMSVRAMMKAVRTHRKSISDVEALIEEIQDQQKAEEEGVESLRGLIRNLARSSAAALFDASAEKNVVRLADARKEGAVVYFALPALRFPALAKAIGRLVINDARLTLSDRGPWLIIMDEISTFGGEQILNLVNQGRGFGARVVLAGQSFADLERSVVDGGASFASQLLGSINSLIVHQLNSPDDAEMAARYAGTRPTIELTAQVVEQTATGAASARGSGEFIVSPDELKELRTAEAFFISKRSGTRTKMASRLSRIAKIEPTVPSAKKARTQRPVYRGGESDQPQGK